MFNLAPGRVWWRRACLLAPTPALLFPSFHRFFTQRDPSGPRTMRRLELCTGTMTAGLDHGTVHSCDFPFDLYFVKPGDVMLCGRQWLEPDRRCGRVDILVRYLLFLPLGYRLAPSIFHQPCLLLSSSVDPSRVGPHHSALPST